MKRYVIVGNGAAGACAAEEIRARDAAGSIVVFSTEDLPHYYRPRLADYMAGEASLESFTLKNLAWYQERRVDLRLGESVTSIDLERKEALGDKSGATGYDALLIASGASCFLPPVKGSDKAGVFTLRGAADAQAIARAAAGASCAAVIGGGLLGLEAARALIALGLKVEVIELADRLLPRQLDGAGAAFLQSALEKMGFSFRLSAKTSEIAGEGVAREVVLEDGRRVACGLALFSAGARPNLELARAAALDIGAAIKVDKNMRASAPGIWAAGDVAEYEGRPCGAWPVAMAQGKIAGASMAGATLDYVPEHPAMMLKVAGVSMISAGEIDAEGALASKVFSSPGAYRKIVLDGDVIKGAIFLGSIDGAWQCVAAMNAGKRLGALAKDIGDEDFDWARI
ncbi:MAG: FAD-dependent oxidoreductase [Treponema sp.]|nr:FAD-dependent oxidoreductase [Treponema sp.]